MIEKIVFLHFLCIYFSCYCIAQNDTTMLEDVIISVYKFSDSSIHAAQNTIVINQNTLDRTNANNTASIIEETGRVTVQKSQLGGGSPVIRGFEASRILLVVDGVRLNNAIYRSGHLQNILSIDNDILDKVEVFLGLSSTIYGSDALGGTIHLQTRNPKLSSNDKFFSNQM